MSDVKFTVTLTATGEVRDADGNLVNPVTAESTHIMTEADLLASGLSAEQIEQIKEQNR